MKRIISTASILAALVLSACNDSRNRESNPNISPIPIPSPTPAQCCGAKPQFSDPAYSSVFTGQVAVTTNFATSGNGFVLEVIDLKNQSIVNTGPPTFNPAIYHGPPAAPWTLSRLGTIFGLTLDNQGNIYTTSTTAYNTDVFPAGATGGEIYKINGVTGAITTFQTLPNPGHVGLGNIHYDCDHRNFYVTNIDNGLIYRLDTSGAILSTWDHGVNLPTATPPSTAIADISSQAFTPRGRLAWGIQANNGRLYYAEWPKASGQTEVWSVGLLPNGAFTAPARREISVPPLAPNNWMPVSDISFSSTGTMFLAERSMSNETTSIAHNSRLLEYTLVSGTWTLLNPMKFKFNVGVAGLADSCAGGVDPDFSSNGRIWVMGDALHFNGGDLIYGLEGVPATGGDMSNSVLIALSGAADFHKYELGDVEIPCPPEGTQPSCPAEFGATTVCPGQATSFTDLSSSASSWSWNFGDTGTSTEQNPTHVYAAAGNYTVTLSVNGGPCTVTHTVIVSPAPPPPVITGPATTCQTGTYSIPPQSGPITWTVTNGTPASGTGPSINVTWNATGNGLVTVTVGNPENCCKTTAQLIVRPCDTPSACCEGINGNVASTNFVAAGGGVYAFTPTLTAGPNLITQVSATIISSSLTFSPTNCGTGGPVNSYITSASSPPTGFASSLPVQFSRDVTWTASNSAGVNLSGNGGAFPFNIQFPPPPSNCSDNLSFCIEYTFTDVRCKTCKIIRCYGPYQRFPDK